MSAIDSNLTAAHAEVKAEIARTDTKTSLLLAFVGALLAGTWTVVKDASLSVPAYMVGALGMALLLAAAYLLLASVRPNLGGSRPVGFPLWATLSAEEITAELAQDQRARDIAGLSRIAVRKFVAVKRAVDLTRAGGALLVLAALIQAGGAA
ncbi:Pycsar system effector family protein [Streptomyces sp. NPDC005900]|uniref:Pycsar system effector family protein n=1 Tax=Streptomyces sp. NPDC005900 TaxID=3154569 RepID=UPI00340D2B59